MPEWWNWHTQDTQNVPPVRAWGFESLLGYKMIKEERIKIKKFGPFKARTASCTTTGGDPLATVSLRMPYEDAEKLASLVDSGWIEIHAFASSFDDEKGSE